MKDLITEQINWIKSGKIGCVFASALVKHHKYINWDFKIQSLKEPLIIPKDTFVLSLLFPRENLKTIKEWALNNGMYFDSVHDLYNGLRIKQGNFVSWVQYFGPDSHVKTIKKRLRRALE